MLQRRPRDQTDRPGARSVARSRGASLDVVGDHVTIGCDQYRHGMASSRRRVGSGGGTGLVGPGSGEGSGGGAGGSGGRGSDSGGWGCIGIGGP